MTITECYIEIARIEQQLKDDRKYLDQRPAWLEEQICGGEPKMQRDRPAELAGLRELEKLWPRHKALLEARRMALNQEIENQKQN
jgi:hypothetical protein